MVVALVLLTFAVFIGIDYLMNREKYRFPIARAEEAPAPVVAGVRMPEGVYFHKGHTWAAQEGAHRFRVGIDEFAARLLGRITHVETPQRGRWFAQGDRGWAVAAGNRRAMMAAPVEGEVVEINEEALAHPERISEDPYGEGWLLVVRTADPEVNLRNLLNGTLARHWMDDAVAELRRVMSPQAAPTAADGGMLAKGIAESMDLEQWEAVSRRFFLL